MRCARNPSTFNRAGISRTEVFVVLVCLGLLIAILVPMTSERRELQRQMACQDRLRKLSEAFAVYLQEHRGAFPWLVDETLPEPLPWTEALIPYLADADAYSKQLGELPSGEAFTIPEYLCPNGRKYHRGANSYVGNGGFGDFRFDVEQQVVYEDSPHSPYIDWDGDGIVSANEVEVVRATGIFWRITAEELIPANAIDDVARGDGASNTLLLTENQNARRWRSGETFDLAFVVGRDRIPFTQNPPEIEPGHEIDLGPYRINAFPVGKPGQSPAPSSTHAGGVNVLYADGSVRMISEKIEPLIYLRAMTPAGENQRAAPFEE